MGLLRKECGGAQSCTRSVTIARNRNRLGMLAGATFPFAKQTRGINQTAGGGWQPNERQHHRNRCFDPLHRESHTTQPEWSQSERLAARSEMIKPEMFHDGYAHLDFNNRRAFAMTTSVAPVSARIASHKLVW